MGIYYLLEFFLEFRIKANIKVSNGSKRTNTRFTNFAKTW